MSWKPEDHYPANPDARPPEDDLAGYCRFYAWEWVSAPRFGERMPWGEGIGQYGGGCQGGTFIQVADELDRLNGALAAAADLLDAEAAACKADSNSLPIPREALDWAAQRLRAVAGNLRAGLYLPDPEPRMEREAVPV